MTVLNASPSTPEKYLAVGRAAAGDSDGETESEAGCSTGLRRLSDAGPDEEVKASASTLKPRPKSYCVRG